MTRGHGRLGDRPPVILYRDGETTGFSAMPTGWEESFVRSTRDTIEALRDGRPPVLTGAQGLEVLRFSLAALRSAEAGRAVRLDEIKGSIGSDFTPLRSRKRAIGPPRAFPCGANSGLIMSGPHRGLDRA